jgi:hypothetical protein
MMAIVLADACAPALSDVIRMTVNDPGAEKTWEAVGDEEMVSEVPSPHCHVYVTAQPFGDVEPEPSTVISVPGSLAYGPLRLARGPTRNGADAISPNRP